MKTRNFFNAIAIASTLGVLCWVISDFYGGMVIYILSYSFIIIPMILFYFLSLIETIISLAKTGLNNNKVKLISHGLLVAITATIILFQSEVFKSKQVLSATLKDDLFHYTLVFREDGSCENQTQGFLGFEETIHGQYQFSGDTIIFKKKPYDNNFIPDTLLIDRDKNVIFKERDKNGKFANKVEWLNHFDINKDYLRN